MTAGLDELLACVERVKDKPQRLVVVTGKPGSGKSHALRELAAKKRWDYVDCRLLVTDDFLELLPTLRAVRAPSMMGDILADYEGDVLLLDRLQSLFVPALHLDPLALLRKLSERFVLVAAWPGFYEDGNLCFQRLGEAQPLRFNAKDLTVWTIKEAEAAGSV